MTDQGWESSRRFGGLPPIVLRAGMTKGRYSRQFGAKLWWWPGVGMFTCSQLSDIGPSEVIPNKGCPKTSAITKEIYTNSVVHPENFPTGALPGGHPVVPAGGSALPPAGSEGSPLSQGSCVSTPFTTTSYMMRPALWVPLVLL